jgi:hypothetical protein
MLDSLGKWSLGSMRFFLRFSEVTPTRMRSKKGDFRQPLPRHECRTTEVTTAMAQGPIPSIEDDPNAPPGEPGSDHTAVVAALDF